MALLSVQAALVLPKDIDRLLAPTKSHRSRASAKGTLKGRTARVLRERFTALERIDFFPTSARTDTAVALLALEQAMEGSAPLPSRLESPLNPASFHDRRWVTRPRPGVDRMASAWLIRRFIDRSATFAFVEDPGESDVPFDMCAGDFSHEGNRCTFEVLADRFGLNTFAVIKVGRLVHDLDMKDTKFGAPEAPVVGRIVDGLRALYADDHTLLERGIDVFAALARSLESDNEIDGAPRLTRRTTRRAGRSRPK